MDSFIARIGGKKILRKTICNRFPDQFSKYVEPFGGAAWVLFYKDRHAPTEVYNDIDNQLVNLFRCIKYHPDCLQKEFDLQLNSRKMFQDYLNQHTEGLTDIQKAARFFYIIKASYGSKGGTYGARPRMTNGIKGIEEIHKRLQGVIIEHMSFEKLIMRYDNADTLFYCDPPYYQAEHFYKNSGFIFDKCQHMLLQGILSQITGKFILTYNDCEFIRSLYSGYPIEVVTRQNNLASRQGKGKIYQELIIKNY